MEGHIMSSDDDQVSIWEDREALAEALQCRMFWIRMADCYAALAEINLRWARRPGVPPGMFRIRQSAVLAAKAAIYFDHAGLGRRARVMGRWGQWIYQAAVRTGE